MKQNTHKEMKSDGEIKSKMHGLVIAHGPATLPTITPLAPSVGKHVFMGTWRGNDPCGLWGYQALRRGLSSAIPRRCRRSYDQLCPLITPGGEIQEPLLGDAAERRRQDAIAPKAAAAHARVSVPLLPGQ